MTKIEIQEQFVDDLKCIEEKLFNIRCGLTIGDELDLAWYIVYKRLKKEQVKEAKIIGLIKDNTR